MIWKICAGLALLGALIGVINWVPRHYIGVGVTQEKATRAAADAKHLADDTAAATIKERDYAAKLAASEAKRLKEREHHAQEMATVVARARAGNSGLRCPVASIQSDAAPASSATAGQAGPPQDGRLVPEAAGDLLGAIRRGVDDVQDYNDLLVEYRRLDAFCKTR